MEGTYNVEVVFDVEIKQEIDDDIQDEPECDADTGIEHIEISVEPQCTQSFKDPTPGPDFLKVPPIGPKVINTPEIKEAVLDKNKKNTTKSDLEPEWVCNLCNNKFRRKGALTKHIKFSCPLNLNKVIVNNVWYKCEVCHKQYGRKDTLNKHKLIHTRTNSDKFECSHCGKIYSTKDGLRIHVNLKHLNIKDDIICCFCQKEFNNKAYRVYHMKHYCPLNPNRCKPPADKCKFCDKVLADMFSRAVHEKRCQFNFGRKKQIICNFCNMEFSSKSHRDRHKKYVCTENKNKIEVKNKQVCEHCNMVLDEDTIDIHVEYFCTMNRPKGERHACTFCKKQFTTQKARNKHMTYMCVMNENKLGHVIKCYHCSNKFSSMEARDKHIELCLQAKFQYT